MGHTHYWRRPCDLPIGAFEAIADDFEKIKPLLGVDILDESDEDAIWFNGVGDDEFETFVFARSFTPQSWQEPDGEERYYDFCKTARKPYDLAVQVALIIIKHHLPNISVSSDDALSGWTKAIWLCQDVLRYGESFELDESCE